MKCCFKFLIYFLIIIFPSIVFCQSAQSEENPKQWKGSASFGFSANSGNTRNKNFLGGLGLKYNRAKWGADLQAAGKFSSSKGNTTAENASLIGTSSYHFFSRYYGFGMFNYKYDDFDPYKYVTTLIIGAGWKVIDNRKVTFNVKIGPGFRRQKEDKTGNINNDLIAYMAGTLKWKITNNATFSQTASVQEGPGNSYMESKTALFTKIVGNLGMEVSYVVKHNTYIPKLSKNRHKTDLSTNIVLIYTF